MFINAESKEEIEMVTKIAQGNQYLESALKRLEVISQDEQKRLEYTARQKVLYDYNTYMEENYDRGYAEGRTKERNALIAKLKSKGMTDAEIDALLN